MQNAKRTVSLVAIGLLMMANQGCAKANFSGGTDEKSTSSSSTTTADSVPDVAGGINFKDIAEIDFKATLKTLPHDTALSSATVLDIEGQKFSNKTALFSPFSLSPDVECSVNGSKVDFSALEKNMKSIQFSTTVSPKSYIPDVGSVVLTIKLRDGSSKSLTLDTSTRDVDVTGVTPARYTAPELVAQLLALSLKARCSIN